MRQWAGTAEGKRITGVSLPPRPMSGRRGRSMSGATDFEETSFEAKLHEIKFLPSGDCRIVLLAPESDADAAVELRKAYPLSLHVRVEKSSHGQ